MFHCDQEQLNKIVLGPVVKTKARDPRAEILGELYALYEEDELSRKKANWGRYRQWCIDRKLPDNIINREKFKASKYYIKLLPLKTFCIRLSHLKGDSGLDALRYMLSVAKDMKNRRQSVGAFILGSIKVK